MALTFKCQELAYAAESSFSENAESPTSNTWDARIPFLSSPTVTLTQDRIRDTGLRARMNEESLSHPGAREASLEFTAYWCGHLTTAAGALTQTWQQDLLSDGLGGGNVAAVGTVISGAASSTTSLNVTAGTNFVAGGVTRVGVKGDGRGDGAPLAIASMTDATPDVLALLTAAPAAPTTAGDVVYACQMAFPDESTSATLGTKRFLVSHTTSGAQYHLMGGQLSGLTFDISNGQLPRLTFRYRFAYWARGADTTPSARVIKDHFCAPVAGGSMFINNVGTTTRTTITPASIRFNVNVGLEPIVGPGGAGTFQFITGWQRTMAKADLSMDIPWAVANGETFWDQANQSYTYKHILFGANHTDGRAVGFYLPKVFSVGERPSRPSEVNGQDYVTVNYTCTDGPTTDGSTELIKSNFRLFAG